jgi:hypothetical protein
VQTSPSLIVVCITLSVTVFGCAGCGTVESTQPSDVASSNANAQQQAVDLMNQCLNDLNAHHYKKVLPSLEKAVELNPTHSFGNYMLGRALLGLGKPAAAMPYLKKAEKQKVTDPTNYFCLGEACQQLGKIDEAVNYYKLYLKQFPGVSAPEDESMITKLIKQKSRMQRLAMLPGGVSKTNYFAFIADEEGILRWPSGKMPLTVSFSVPKRLSSRLPALKKMFLAACRPWEESSDGAVQFRALEGKSKGRIHCEFTDDPHRLNLVGELGGTQNWTSASGIDKSEMVIGVVVDKQLRTDAQLHNTLIHEIGHSIGLNDHSPHPDDVLYFYDFTIRDTELMESLSPRDIETLRLVYGTKSPAVPRKSAFAAMARRTATSTAK